MARAGRRPGQTETRERILAAARHQFAERGFGGATIRGIAADAGVNPALIHHFFGTKEQVFVAALNVPVHPAVMVETILEGPREQVGERLVRLFLGLWQEPVSRQSFFALMRSVFAKPEYAGLMRQFIEHTVLVKVADTLGVPKLRVSGAAAQLMGVALVRYVVGVEPMASASEEELVELLAPVIQHYFDG